MDEVYYDELIDAVTDELGGDVASVRPVGKKLHLTGIEIAIFLAGLRERGQPGGEAGAERRPSSLSPDGCVRVAGRSKTRSQRG